MPTPRMGDLAQQDQYPFIEGAPDDPSLGEPSARIIVSPPVSGMTNRILPSHPLAQAGGEKLRDIANYYGTLGNAMQGGLVVQPAVPGMQSDEEASRQALTNAEFTKRGMMTGLDATTGGMPFARANTLGAAGGRIMQPPPGGPAPRTQAWRDLRDPNAQFPQYAEKYPEIGPPQLKLKEEPSFPGETYLAKLLTPEADVFQKARLKISANMNKKGFDAYFDPEKRGLVDMSKYPPPNADTSTIVPKMAASIEKYKVINAPATRARLEAAIKRGEELGDAHDWYFMNQLEHEYLKELGPKAGRTAFLDEFAVPMAATTSGQNPQGNLLTAHYLEHLRKKNQPAPTEGYDLPTPVGGRRASVNLRDYRQMRERGGYSGLSIDQPKMHDFSRSMIGDLRNPVMDEQMAGGMLKGQPSELISGARNTAYGQLQGPVRAAAAKRGVEPGAIQDIAWAGFKNEPGKPMIQIINEAIERTHRLTGMARSEIVRRGLVRKEIPLYGVGGAMIAPAVIGQMGDLADQGKFRVE